VIMKKQCLMNKEEVVHFESEGRDHIYFNLESWEVLSQLTKYHWQHKMLEEPLREFCKQLFPHLEIFQVKVQETYFVKMNQLGRGTLFITINPQDED